MVYCNLDTVLTSVKLRKHVYWLLLSVLKLIFVSYAIIFEFWAQSEVLQTSST